MKELRIDEADLCTMNTAEVIGKLVQAGFDMAKPAYKYVEELTCQIVYQQKED